MAKKKSPSEKFMSLIDKARANLDDAENVVLWGMSDDDDSYISKLEKEVADLQSELEDVRADMQFQQDEAETLDQIVSEQQQEIGQLLDEIAELDDRNYELQKELEEALASKRRR